MIVRWSEGAPAGRSIPGFACLVPLVWLCVSPIPASAGDWQPTISTTAGEDVVRRVVAPAPPLPQWNDPRLRRPPAVKKSPQPEPKQGLWDPIITGALPISASEEEELREGKTHARVAQSNTGENLSPVRQVPSAGSGAQREGAAKAPAGDDVQNGQTRPSDLEPSKTQAQHRPLEALPPDATAAQQYCFNTIDAAAEARFAWQAKKIREMEAELEARAADLEQKTEEFKKWLARRDEFSRKAQEKLVGFYSKMRPDAAASHLDAMDDETAAALLTKLEPKVASVVMAEITPEKAAKIAAIISGAAKKPPLRRPRPRNQGRLKPPEDGSAATPSSRTRS